jgi:polyferredoxin
MKARGKTTGSTGDQTGTTTAASAPDKHRPPLGRWQRIGGLLLITGGLMLATKFAMLLAAYPGMPPLLGPLPVEALLISGGLLLTYAGATALPVPFLRRRPRWTLALAVPVTVLAYMMFAGTLDALVLALVAASDHPIVRLETGMLTYGLVSAGVGFLLWWRSPVRERHGANMKPARRAARTIGSRDRAPGA